MTTVIEIDDIDDVDDPGLDTRMSGNDGSPRQSEWMEQQQETMVGTEAASSSAAATPPQHGWHPFNFPPSHLGCSKSIYCGRSCSNGKHIGPGGCKLVEPPVGYVPPPGFATFAQDFARINGNKGRKRGRKSEGAAYPEATPRVAPAPEMGVAANVVMASLASPQPSGAPVAASEEVDASDTTGSDEDRQQSDPQAVLAADLKRECQRLTAENRLLTARLDTMEEDLKVFKKRLVAAILQA